MKIATIIHCSKCQQPIVSENGIGFVRFKVPGQQDYHFFHNRFRGADCWESYVNGRRHDGHGR